MIKVSEKLAFSTKKRISHERAIPSPNLDPDYTRAFCGFEPYLLELSSHKDLARFVLVRHFRLGLALP